jgi:hypothetical protein
MFVTVCVYVTPAAYRIIPTIVPVPVLPVVFTSCNVDKIPILGFGFVDETQFNHFKRSF